MRRLNKWKNKGKKLLNMKLAKKSQYKVKHLVLVVIALALLLSVIPTQFATVRNDMTVVTSLDKMVLRKTLNGIESGAKKQTFEKGTEFSMSGTSTRLDPDHAERGLPDLQISIKDFKVSDKNKERKYTYKDGGSKYEVKITRHDVTMKISIEVEGKALVIGYAVDEVKQIYWEDMKLLINLKGSGGYFGITDGKTSGISTEESTYGKVDFDSSWCKVEGDSVTIDNLSGDPSKIGTDAVFSVHINKAILYSGKQSHTTTMKVTIPLVAATVKQVSTSSGDGGNGGNGGSDDGGYTDYQPTVPTSSGLSTTEMLLGIIVVVVLVAVMVLFVGGRRR
jgi:hypothetical protein